MVQCDWSRSAVEQYSTGEMIWITGPILYFASALFGLSQLILHCVRSEKVIHHYMYMLTIFVVSLTLRGVWFMITCPTGTKPAGGNTSSIAPTGFGYSEAAISFDWAQMVTGTADATTTYEVGVKIMSKLSLLLYFTAFTMYVYLWAKVMPFLTSVKCLTILFIIINVVLWVVTIVLETIAILETTDPNLVNSTKPMELACGNNLYNSIICILAITQLLIAIMFVAYGIRLMKVLRKAAVSSRRDSQSRKRMERRVLGVSIPSSLLFLMRSVLFLWCPIAQQYIPHSEYMYPWMYYLVPDLIPALLIFVMTIPNAGASKKNVQYESL